MTANVHVYTQFGVGAYLSAPTGVRAPWRVSCLSLVIISGYLLKVKAFMGLNQHGSCIQDA